MIEQCFYFGQKFPNECPKVVKNSRLVFSYRLITMFLTITASLHKISVFDPSLQIETVFLIQNRDFLTLSSVFAALEKLGI